MNNFTTRVLVIITFLLEGVASGQAPPHVAPTNPLTPQEQQTKFVLPEGFEIQLVVSEPIIGQPMNLNFDARGRLWITHSVEYPYPAKTEGVEPRGRFSGVGDHPPRDRVTIIESLANNGRNPTIRHFAKGLNIPIGQVPLGNGSQALVYSIPAIFRHTDTNHDGQADQSEELYGGFGNKDTHGMASSFTPWIDGWIYGCHGFSNHSVIQDASGNKTEMTSGNTYRFRPDGSRFEPFTFGQVNPFGMAFDPLGNLYDADCHSMPVYQLLRGASYPHFGKVAGPLGFGPVMINHNHGSTGICGVAYYASNHFPLNYRDSLFICNPVTGRVHHDRLQQFDQQTSTKVQQQVAELLRELPSIEQRLLDVIATRRAAYRPEQTDHKRGQALFAKNCAACHKLGNEGKVIGPQLEGVGTRGLDRLLEDVIDPNRNVDVAFRTQTLITRSGKIYTGLRRREEGKVLVIADQRGTEISIPLEDIEATKPSRLSLMPANFDEILKPQEMSDLIAYLLTLRSEQPEPKPSTRKVPEENPLPKAQ